MEVGPETLWMEMVLIFILILLNGFFAGSEIALVSARRSRIQQLAEEGDVRAKLVKKLQGEPDRFFATVQIGVTFVGTLASAVGGVAAVETIRPLIQQIPWRPIQAASGTIALGVVVLVITYLSLIFGELVPKSLAHRYPEQIALVVARPIDRFSRLSTAPVRVLAFTTNAILRLFRVGLRPEDFSMTEEELKLIIREGREKGIFDQAEQELIHSVFEFTEASVKKVMVPRPRIHAIPLDASPEEILKEMVETGHSRYPVYGEGLDDIRGIVRQRDVLKRLAEKKPLILAEILHPAFFVPETMPVSQLLKELQRRRMGMALVVDEYGGIEGLATVEDLIEEIVGEIRDESEMEARPVERLRDGSLIVDASTSIRDLVSEYGLSFPESPEYETLAGFVLSQLQQIPKGGEIIYYQDYKLTVVDMEGRRIAKVKVERYPK